MSLEETKIETAIETKEIKRRLVLLEHALFGNGKPGLKESFTEFKVTVQSSINLQRWQFALLCAYVFKQEIGPYIFSLI